MARPSKYDWESIEKAYIQGAEVSDICKKYKIAKKTLQNKISECKWEITGTLKSDINEFKEVMGKVTQNAHDNPETADILTEKIITILEDNSLMQNNRRIAQALQGIMSQEIRNKKVNVSNIKSMTGALKDLESIANPRPETVVNNTTQSFSGVKLIDA